MHGLGKILDSLGKIWIAWEHFELQLRYFVEFYKLLLFFL